VYRVKNSNKFVSYGLRKEYDTTAIHVDVNIVRNDVLDTEAFKAWRPEFNDAEFILEDDKYICGWAVEKMSKSMFNVVNPDVIVEEYGADTLRLYEMFLGPLEAHKPWDTNGIDGVHKFLKKLWRLFHNGDTFEVSEADASKEELKVLHKTIKKIQDDIERFSFNTSISAFMICVNELSSLKCNNKAVLEDFLKLLAPFAPHISEELWSLCGNTESITKASFPEFNESFVAEDTHSYPVSFNGKMRFKLELSLSMSKDEIVQEVLNCDQAQKWIDGKTPKKVIIVPKKIINIVV
jgi:leucyl-tRNA synthetase